MNQGWSTLLTRGEHPESACQQQAPTSAGSDISRLRHQQAPTSAGSDISRLRHQQAPTVVNHDLAIVGSQGSSLVNAVNPTKIGFRTMCLHANSSNSTFETAAS